MYSASAVDVATVDWRLLAYEMGPPLSVEDKACCRAAAFNIALPICVNIPL